MSAPDRNILTAALLLNATATNVTQARQHLTAEIRLCDGTPTSTSGADSDGRPGERTIAVKYQDADGNELVDHVPVTIVEAAAIQRQHLEQIRDDLNAMCRGILTMANELARTTQHIIGTRIEVPRCTATGRDGAIIWGDPTCSNVPSRGALCDRCARAEWVWRKERNLPPRLNSLFSAPAVGEG